MDHDILIAELKNHEKMHPNDRIELAKIRREQQIEKFHEFEYTSPIIPKSRKSKFHVSLNYALLEAAKRQDVEEIKEFLKNGADPSFYCLEGGVTALHEVVIQDNIQLTKILLDHGADINALDSEKWTPLHAAAAMGNLDMTKFLIANGADLLAVNMDKNLPYDLCDVVATLDFIETEMVNRGVTQEMIEEARKESERQMLKDMKELVQRGENLDSCDQENGATYLHIAAANGYQSVVEYLLKHGASPDVKDMDKMTAIKIAKQRDFPNIVTFIKDYMNGHFVA